MDLKLRKNDKLYISGAGDLKRCFNSFVTWGGKHNAFKKYFFSFTGQYELLYLIQPASNYTAPPASSRPMHKYVPPMPARPSQPIYQPRRPAISDDVKKLETIRNRSKKQIIALQLETFS